MPRRPQVAVLMGSDSDLPVMIDCVRVLEEYGYGRRGEWVGLDVKTMRTQKQANNTTHLANSKRFFELLLAKVRSFNRKKEAEFIRNRDYEGLERMVIEHLLGPR